MIRNQENNKEELEFINAKLQRDYTKLVGKNNNKSEDSKLVDALSFGSDSNEKVILGSFVVPLAPMAVGVSSIAAGLVTIIPTIMEEKAAVEASEQLTQLKDFSTKAFNFGENIIAESIPLLYVPLGIVALSLSVKLYKMLKEKKQNKANYNFEMIKLIDDVLTKKEDDSLDFINEFIKRVDLSENKEKYNIELLKYFTYHRLMVQQEKIGNVSADEVEEAYDNVILYLYSLKYKKDCPNNIKNSRYINILIDEYVEKERERQLFGEERVR